MAARLRGRILVLSLIALLFLPLAAQAEPSRVVPAEEILKKIEMGQPVEYDNVIIVGDLDVSALNLTKEPVQRTYYETFYLDLLDYEMIVASPISITNSRIEGSVNLNGTILQNVTSFQNTTFDLPAFILSSSFKRYADFRMVKFNKDADFEGAKFNKDADFGRVKFNKDVDFRYAQFNQTVDFRYAQFNHIAYFRNAQFNQTADFSYAQFNQTADFWQAQFNQTADFTCAQFNQ
ncbi:MAG: pentapeptide repeat-containing protein, partial [Methanothrix sp.]|nr:pentapeptide repeat-containing protein [Methanothrix sp.]